MYGNRYALLNYHTQYKRITLAPSAHHNALGFVCALCLHAHKYTVKHSITIQTVTCTGFNIHLTSSKLIPSLTLSLTHMKRFTSIEDSTFTMELILLN